MNRMIRVAIYQLKKQYGNGPVDIYQAPSAEVNLATGVKTLEPTVTRVATAVVLPAKITRETVSSISKISADKAFVYGGTFDRTRRMFLIDKQDVPNLSLTADDWLVYQSRQYKVARFDEFESSSLWSIIAHEVLGERPRIIHTVSVTDAIGFTQN